MKTSLLKGKKGMVLIIVIAAVMLMSVVAVGVLSRNVSRAIVDEKGIQRLQAEVLAKGAFWRAYQNGGTPPSSFTETIGTKTYTVNYTLNPGAGPSGTDQIMTQVTY
jgi:hypothetical protein